jgi:glucokinase-like ROK family protein
VASPKKQRGAALEVRPQQIARAKALSKPAQKELRLLRVIQATPNVSRIELAKRTGASAASMTAIVQRLIDRGLVVETGKGSTVAGRKPVSLNLRNDLGYVIGVDLGSFLLRVIVADVVGNICYRSETETKMSEGRERVLSRTFAAIHDAIKQSHLPLAAIKGIGMAHSGVIDSQRGIVLCLPRPGQMTQWRNIPLREMVKNEFRVPSALDDSARMMALAEKHFGLGQDVSDFLFVEVGMGIGAALFMDGKLYRGPGGTAGELGHMTVDENGPLCSCGNNGCLEAVASCASIMQTVRGGIRQGVNSKISELVDGDLDRVSIEIVVQAAKENDTLALRVLDEAISHIGVVLADVINLLNPSTVIFGGPLFRAAHELLLDRLRQVIRHRALEKSANEVQLKVSHLGGEAAALGAARLISGKILEDLFVENVLSGSRDGNRRQPNGIQEPGVGRTTPPASK